MTQEVNRAITGLIETLTDGERGLKAGAANVTRPDLKQVLKGYATQRAQFARTLQSQVERQAEYEAEDSGGSAETINRGWMPLRPAMTLPDDLGVLEECEKVEGYALEVYRDALEAQPLGGARSIVSEQYAKIRAAHEQIVSLLNSLKATES